MPDNAKDSDCNGEKEDRHPEKCEGTNRFLPPYAGVIKYTKRQEQNTSDPDRAAESSQYIPQNRFSRSS